MKHSCNDVVPFFFYIFFSIYSVISSFNISIYTIERVEIYYNICLNNNKFNVHVCRLISAYSKSGKLFCVVREVESIKESKQYLEVWDDCSLVKNYDLGALDVHGKIYADR